MPVGAVSSLFISNKIANAQDLGEIVTQKEGIITKIANNPSILEKFTEKEGVITKIFKSDPVLLEQIKTITSTFIQVIDWFKNIKENVYELSINLFSFVFETLMNLILYTPLFLFDNTYTQHMNIIFSLISVLAVSLLTIYEGTMRMLNKKHTDFKKIIQRFAIVAGASGFMPFVFEKMFKVVNELTQGITKIGSSLVSSESLTNFVDIALADVFFLLIFDVAVLILLIPVLFQNGRRWWDLFCLSAVSPLALSAWVFDRHSHIFRQWWESVKRLSLVQLVYATFITLIALFVHGTQSITGVGAMGVKLLILIGSLHALSNPPRIVRRYTESSEDIFDYSKSAIGTLHKNYETLTLKKFTPLNHYRKVKHKEKKSMIEERLKQGKRFIK